MFSAFTKSFQQLSDPASIKALIYSALASLVLLIVSLGALFWAGELLSPERYGLEGFWYSVLDWFLVLFTGVALLFVGYFLFAPIMVGVSGLFAEKIIENVEHKYYPNSGSKRADRPLIEDLKLAARAIGVMLLVNIMFLPLFFIPLIGQMIFICVNAFLMGREYFYQVAITHMSQSQAEELFDRHQSDVFKAGLLIACISLIPFLNVTIIILGSSMFTHIFHTKMVPTLPKKSA